jgi:pimeloyl-ACP methyl ester carboxylesterase
MSTPTSLPPPTLDEWERGGDFLPYRGHRIFYRTSTAAAEPGRETLLLIHGFPTASWDWAKLWGPLASHFRLVALDLIGFGFSDKPSDFPYSTMAQAELIQTLMRTLGIARAHVLAHDYGDTIAQELLARQLDGDPGLTLASLCLLNGGLFPETHRPVLMQKLLLGPLGPLLARLTNRRVFTQNLRQVFGPATPPSPAELDGFWQLAARADGIAVLRKHLRYMVERRQHRARWVGALQRAALPLRLIDGAADPVSGAHMAVRYRELIAQPDVVLLEGIGHFPQVEAPAAVLSAFLAFHGRGGPG